MLASLRRVGRQLLQVPTPAESSRRVTCGLIWAGSALPPAHWVTDAGIYGLHDAHGDSEEVVLVDAVSAHVFNLQGWQLRLRKNLEAQPDLPESEFTSGELVRAELK